MSSHRFFGLRVAALLGIGLLLVLPAVVRAAKVTYLVRPVEVIRDGMSRFVELKEDDRANAGPCNDSWCTFLQVVPVLP